MIATAVLVPCGVAALMRKESECGIRTDLQQWTASYGGLAIRAGWGGVGSLHHHGDLD